MTEKKFVDGAGLKHFKSKLDALFDNKVDKEVGKSLSTNDFTNAHKSKVDAIPANPKYTDNNTTYKAGDGLSLSGTTFSVSGTIARKTDIPSLEGYAKLTDVPKIDAITGSIDLSNYVTKDQVDNMFATYDLFLDDKVDKESLKGLSTNDFTNEYKKKLDGLTDIDLSGYALKTELESRPSLTTFRDKQWPDGLVYNLKENGELVRYTNYKEASDIKVGIPILNLALKSDLPKLDEYAKLNQIPDVSRFASKVDLNNKVDKVNGKGLSTNDFTTSEKEKLSRMFEPEEILVYNGTSVIQKIYAFNGVIWIKARVDKTATRVDLPYRRITHIPPYFCSNTNITTVSLFGVVIIEDSAFYGSKLSGMLTIYESVAIMGNDCFKSNNLEEIEYRSSTDIPYQAFSTNRINKINLYEGITLIGKMAFQHNNLTEVDIPKSVKHVGSYAFMDNPLKTVTISRYTTYEYNSFPSTARIIYKD